MPPPLPLLEVKNSLILCFRLQGVVVQERFRSWNQNKIDKISIRIRIRCYPTDIVLVPRLGMIDVGNKPSPLKQ